LEIIASVGSYCKITIKMHGHMNIKKINFYLP